jgi:hypothetical protein
METSIDATTGGVTVRYTDGNGKESVLTVLEADTSN